MYNDQDYNFPIQTEKIFTSSNLQIPKKMAVIRTDRMEYIGIVSDIYNLVPHSTVLTEIKKVLKDCSLDYTEKTRLEANGAQLYATYDLPELQADVEVGDSVSFRIIVSNSYDGSCSITYSLAAMRLICSNGLISPKSISVLRQKHLRNSQNELFNSGKLSTLINDFNNKLIPNFTRMSSTTLNISQIGLFFDAMEKKKTFPKWIIGRIKNEYSKVNKPSIWNLYNSMTYVFTHSTSTIKYNRALEYSKKSWSLAMKLMRRT